MRHSRVTLLEALASIRTEEIRLRAMGLLSSPSFPSILAASTPATSPATPSPVVPSLVTATVGRGLHYTYCNEDGHVQQTCYKKKKDLRRGGRPPQGTGGSSSQRSSGASDSQELLTLLRRMAALAPSGSVGSAMQSSRERPPSTSSSGISPWILDFGASFHMTSDSTSLTSISPLAAPIIVQIADSTSLSVAGRGTLSNSSFHIPVVSHVPKLTIQFISAGQLTDHGCRVILDSDSCCVQDRRTGTLVGIGLCRHDSQRL